MLRFQNYPARTKLLLLCASLMILTACNTVSVVQQEAWWSTHVSDDDDSVSIVEVVRSATSSDEILLAIALKNESSLQKNIAKYKVEWFTAGGMPIHSILGRWNTVSLLPNERHTVETVAPSSMATDFFITLRKANSNSQNPQVGG